MKDITTHLYEALGNNILLWIDDIRNPQDSIWKGWILAHFGKVKPVWVKSYKECVAWITKNGLPDAVSFDHDLADVENPDEEKTGYDCCKYIVDYCLDNNLKFPTYDIQSDNGPGRENIRKYIENYKKRCER